MTSQIPNMGVDDTDEILTALGVEDGMFESPETRFKHRLLSAKVDARRDGMEYWRLF